MTGEEVTGWFDSNGQEISDSPSNRLHVKTEGIVKFLEINGLNKSDRGQYECRGTQRRVRVMLYVECKYQSPVILNIGNVN